MPPQGGGVPQRYHAVHYYGASDSLFTTVSAYLGAGRAAADPPLVIATEDHRAGILEPRSRAASTSIARDGRVRTRGRARACGPRPDLAGCNPITARRVV